MGDLIGFIILPAVILVGGMCSILRLVEVPIVKRLGLRGTGILLITIFEILACFALTYYVLQTGWGAAASHSPEIYGPFGSFFWQLLLINFIAYVIFYAIKLRSLLKLRS